MGEDHEGIGDEWIAEAKARQAAWQKEWKIWGRNAPVADRIMYSAWIPSIESGNRKELDQVADCLLEQVKGGSATTSALRLLTSLALRKCLERGLAPPKLLEVATLLLEPSTPKHKRARPEERERAIEYMIAHAGNLPGRRKIAAEIGISDSTIRKWKADAHFVQEVNERAGRKILPEPGTQ